MKVRIYSGIYPGPTNYARFTGPVNSKDFTADVPGAGLARLAAISIDNTGTLNYYNGSTFVAGLPMPDASLPDVPASEMLISAVRLVNGMTAIEESNFDLEMRPLMANGTVNIKVSEVWESDFGAVALEADANGNIGIGTSGPDAQLDVLDTAGAQLRLTFEDGVKFDFTVDTNHDLTIKPSSTGQIILQPTTDSTDFFQVLDADGGTPIVQVDSVNEAVGLGTIPDTNTTLHVVKNSFVPQRLERQTTATSSAAAVFDLLLNGPSINMADGFGPSFNFAIQDDAAVRNPIARIAGVRDGADNSGELSFDTASTGSITTKLTIKNDGKVGIGTDSPGTELTISATIPRLLFVDETTANTGLSVSVDSSKMSIDSRDDDGSFNAALVIVERSGNVGLNGVVTPSTELDIGAGSMEFAEMTAPGAGASNTARLYAVDNGAGKTQLVVIFNTGAAQVLATQP
jgi:hypothetical protein